MFTVRLECWGLHGLWGHSGHLCSRKQVVPSISYFPFTDRTGHTQPHMLSCRQRLSSADLLDWKDAVLIQLGLTKCDFQSTYLQNSSALLGADRADYQLGMLLKKWTEFQNTKLDRVQVGAGTEIIRLRPVPRPHSRRTGHCRSACWKAGEPTRSQGAALEETQTWATETAEDGASCLCHRVFPGAPHLTV